MSAGKFVDKSFQFHYGTIRSLPGLSRCPYLSYFNSTMVRLEGEPPAWSPHGMKFQFHYGTIRRISEVQTTAWSEEFQFHYGTIRS